MGRAAPGPAGLGGLDFRAKLQGLCRSLADDGIAEPVLDRHCISVNFMTTLSADITISQMRKLSVSEVKQLNRQ